MDNIILSAALILTLPLLSIPLHVELLVGRGCNPEEPKIIIRGSHGEKMTGIVFTDPAGRTIGQAHLTLLNVEWEPKEAYKTRSVFDVVNDTERLYEFRLAGFKFNESGEYRVDVKHGGDGSSQFEIPIRKVDERYLWPKIYHDDRLVHGGDYLNITARPELVLQTGGSLRANVTVQVNDYEKFCRNTSQCTTAIGQDLEPGSYRINVSYRVRYVEQCFRTDIDYSGTVTLNVDLAAPPVISETQLNFGVSSGWMTSTYVLLGLITCGTLAGIVRFVMTKTNTSKPRHAQANSLSSAAGDSQQSLSETEGTSPPDEGARLLLDPSVGQHQSPASETIRETSPPPDNNRVHTNPSGGLYEQSKLLAEGDPGLDRILEARRIKCTDTSQCSASNVDGTSAQTASLSEGYGIERPINTEQRNRVEHVDGDIEIDPLHKSTSGDIRTESDDENCGDQLDEQEETDTNESADVGLHEISTAALMDNDNAD